MESQASQTQSEAVLSKFREIYEARRTAIIIVSITLYHILSSVIQIFIFQAFSSMIKNCNRVHHVFSDSAELGLFISLQVLLFLQIIISLIMVHAIAKKNRILAEIWTTVVLCILFFYGVLNIYESTLFLTCQGWAQALGMFVLTSVIVVIGLIVTKCATKIAMPWPKKQSNSMNSNSVSISPQLKQSSPA